LWNLLLYAIDYDQTEMVTHLLTDSAWLDKVDPMAIQRPPLNNQEYHIMSKYEAGAKQEKTQFFAFELVAKNRNVALLMVLLETFRQCFSFKDVCDIANLVLGEPETDAHCEWAEGVKEFLRSSTVRSVFTHLRPEEKEEFMVDTLVDPLFRASKHELETTGANNKSMSLLKLMTKELRSAPYAAYAVLRYPSLFQKFGILDKALGGVADDDIIVYLAGHCDNLQRLRDYSRTGKQNVRMTEIIEIAEQKTEDQQLMVPYSPIAMLLLIQNRDTAAFVEYFESGKSYPLLYRYFGHQITFG
jgi:hypothetical protein